jgi:serine/threonine protein kinase
MIAVKQVDVPKRPNKTQSTLINSLYTEIELLKDLDHDNVVNYLGFSFDDEHVNIFLEYISGGSILTALQKQGPLAMPVIQSFVQQILSGLEYLHERSIWHRACYCVGDDIA